MAIPANAEKDLSGYGHAGTNDPAHYTAIDYDQYDQTAPDAHV